MERSLFFAVVLLTVVCWQGLLQAASIDEDLLKALEKLERKDSVVESHKRADIEELRTLMSKWVAKRVLRYKYKNDEYGWLDGFKKKGSTRSCNSDAVGKCTSSLQDIYAFAGALMFPVSEGQLAKSCGEISSTSQCVQGAGCSDADSISVQWGWTGIKDSLSYLCTDSGKQGLSKFQGCVSDKADDYLITLLDCLSVIPESKDCSYYNAQLKCYADTARDLCDSKDFAVTYYVKAYQPLTTHDSGCTYSYQKKEALRQKIQSLLSQLDK